MAGQAGAQKKPKITDAMVDAGADVLNRQFGYVRESAYGDESGHVAARRVLEAALLASASKE